MRMTKGEYLRGTYMLVEDGVWDVNSEGVATPHIWFKKPKIEDGRFLVWATESR